MTSADICQCVRLGTPLLISIFCMDDELYNVSHKWHQWANSSTEGNLSRTTLYAALVIFVECFVTKVEIFLSRNFHIRWRIWTGGPNPPFIGITDWLLFFCQEQCEGTGGGKSGDQPPKDVYDTHCNAGIDISPSLPYQIWVLRPSVSCMRQ